MAVSAVSRRFFGQGLRMTVGVQRAFFLFPKSRLQLQAGFFLQAADLHLGHT